MSEPTPPPPPTSPARGPEGGGWPGDNEPPAPQISAFNRLWKVLVAPSETFQAIAAKPTWGLALAVTMLVVVGGLLVAMNKIDFQESVRTQLEAQGQTAPANLESAAKVVRIITMVSGILAPPILFLILAAVYLGLNLFGGKLRFPQSFSVLLHSGMPSLVKGLLGLPVILSRSSLTLQDLQMGALKSNLGAFAPEGVNASLKVVLNSLDVFTLWQVVLGIIGYSIAARVPRKTAAAYVLTLFVGFVLLFAGLAALRPH
jgi:hypothetical protein